MLSGNYGRNWLLTCQLLFFPYLPFLCFAPLIFSTPRKNPEETILRPVDLLPTRHAYRRQSNYWDIWVFLLLFAKNHAYIKILIPAGNLTPGSIILFHDLILNFVSKRNIDDDFLRARLNRGGRGAGWFHISAHSKSWVFRVNRNPSAFFNW